jgi:integrase/recombinase XerD
MCWTTIRGSICASNTGSALRQSSGRFLRPDTAHALEALRPLPRFESHLGRAMLEHVKRMRLLGSRYEGEASRLLAFDRYLEQRTGASAQPLPWLIREYADLASTPEARLERLQSGRTLAQGLQRLDQAITPPILDRDKSGA